MKYPADEITRSCSLIHAEIASLHTQFYGVRGYIERLTDAAQSGAFITSKTEWAINLKNDADFLQRVANDLLTLRAAMIANEKNEKVSA